MNVTNRARSATRWGLKMQRRIALTQARGCCPGRIFDDRGNRMAPASAHKQGARYRYYVSAPMMQGWHSPSAVLPGAYEQAQRVVISGS